MCGPAPFLLVEGVQNAPIAELHGHLLALNSHLGAGITDYLELSVAKI